MPAPIVNGGGDRFWKWKEFKLSRARDLDLDLGSGHTAHRRASLIDLYLYTKFHSNWRNFLWTDGRTDIFPPLILLGRLLEVDLKRQSFEVVFFTKAMLNQEQWIVTISQYRTVTDSNKPHVRAKQRSISGHLFSLTKIWGQFQNSGQFQDNFEILGISGLLGPLQ